MTLLNFHCSFKVFANKRSFNSFVKLMAASTPVDISSIRGHYRSPNDSFDVSDLKSKDPIKQFQHWFDIILQNKLSKEPNAVNIATSSKEGRPSNRMVLLKDFSDNGFKFFTNYNSRKGKELEENPYASMCFYWEAISRQVRVEGKVRKITPEESAEYFGKRPLNSRISAFISDQSEVIKDRQVLVTNYEKALETYGKENNVPKPEAWGGYLLVPEEFEFWQGNDIRLHDRLRFRRPRDGEVVKFGEETGLVEGENGWIIDRLSP